MHDIAENGVAAHWLYKQATARPTQAAQRFRWVQDLLEILENSGARRVPREHQARALPGPGLLLHAEGPADPAAARRDAGRLRLRRAQPGRRHLRRRQDQRPADAAAPRAAERRPGRDHDRARRHAVAAMGALRRHRQGARPHPPLRAASSSASSIATQGRAALAKAFRQEGLDGSEKVLEPALKTLKLAIARRSLRRRRQRQYRAEGRGARRLSGTAPGAARAAHAAASLPPRPRGRAARRAASGMPITGLVAGHGGQLRRLLPSAARRSHRRHRHHRQGRHDPYPRLPDAGELRRHARALHRRGLGPAALPTAAARATAIPAGSA